MAEEDWVDRMRQISADRKTRASGGNEAANIPKKDSSVKYRIDDAAGSQLLLWAGLFDVLSCIPLVNTVVVFFAQFCFFVFFNFFYGVPTLGKRTWIWYLIAWVVELIPFLSIFPTYTLMVFRIIAISRIEDRLGALNLVADSKEAKALARLTLQKNKQLTKGLEKNAVARAGRKNDGGFDRDKIKEKRGNIADRRADLNKSLSGVKSDTPTANINYLTGANARENKREQQKPAQDNFSGVQASDPEAS